MSVRSFLQEALGYDNSLIESSVRTVFLNNSPVDDIDIVHIKDGDRMALGGAMPGLVGICMGRDNPYKEFRSGISVNEERMTENAEPVCLSVKIFSTLAVETGVDVLKKGIAIDAGLLADFIEKRMEQVIEANGMNSTKLIAFLRKTTDVISLEVEFS